MFQIDSKVLRAIYRKTVKREPLRVDSQLIFYLSETEWVPLRDGRFVMPKQASRATLAEGLKFSPNSKWLELVAFETDCEQRTVDHEKVAAKLAEAGFKFNTAADLKRTLEFSRLDSDDQEQMLASSKARQQDLIDLPDAPLRNPERRADLLTAQALDQGSKESRQSLRTVAVGYAASKTDSSQYLEMMYTKPNGEMICQACKREMPFKLPSGEYYFEAVEVIKSSPKRFRETFLALCPNHAAMYRHANAQVEEMQQLILAATSQEVTVNLAGQAISLYFNQTHMADLRTCLKTLEVEDLQTI